MPICTHESTCNFFTKPRKPFQSRAQIQKSIYMGQLDLIIPDRHQQGISSGLTTVSPDCVDPTISTYLFNEVFWRSGATSTAVTKTKNSPSGDYCRGRRCPAENLSRVGREDLVANKTQKERGLETAERGLCRRCHFRGGSPCLRTIRGLHLQIQCRKLLDAVPYTPARSTAVQLACMPDFQYADRPSRKRKEANPTLFHVSCSITAARLYGRRPGHASST